VSRNIVTVTSFVGLLDLPAHAPLDFGAALLYDSSFRWRNQKLGNLDGNRIKINADKASPKTGGFSHNYARANKGVQDYLTSISQILNDERNWLKRLLSPVFMESIESAIP